MNKRSFLQACLALAAAPAIVRADSLMRIVPRNLLIDTRLPWEIPGAIVRNQTFYVDKPVAPASNTIIDNCNFIFTTVPASMLFLTNDVENIVMNYNHFVSAQQEKPMEFSFAHMTVPPKSE